MVCQVVGWIFKDKIVDLKIVWFIKIGEVSKFFVKKDLENRSCRFGKIILFIQGNSYQFDRLKYQKVQSFIVKIVFFKI